MGYPVHRFPLSFVPWEQRAPPESPPAPGPPTLLGHGQHRTVKTISARSGAKAAESLPERNETIISCNIRKRPFTRSAHQSNLLQTTGRRSPATRSPIHPPRPPPAAAADASARPAPLPRFPKSRESFADIDCFSMDPFLCPSSSPS